MIYPLNKKKLPFIVVGTGRCGTVTIAQLLTSVGIPCGHERIFGPEGISDTPSNSNVSKQCGLKDHSFVLAESSYMAVPYLRHEMIADATIIHVIRNPIDVILSFNNKLQFWHHRTNIWEKFIALNVPEIHKCRNPLEKNCYFVTRWTEWIQEQSEGRKYIRIRIEKDCDKLLDYLKIPIGLRPKVEVANSHEVWNSKLPQLKNPATTKDIMVCMGDRIKLIADGYK